jgi:hypothetical protein
MADYLDSNSAQLAAVMTQLAAQMAHDTASRPIPRILTEALRYAPTSPGVCEGPGYKVLVRTPLPLPLPAQYFRPTDSLLWPSPVRLALDIDFASYFNRRWLLMDEPGLLGLLCFEDRDLTAPSKVPVSATSWTPTSSPPRCRVKCSSTSPTGR